MPEIGFYMSSPVVSVDSSESVRNAAQSMYQKKVGAVLVKKEGDFVGILTKTDLMHKVIGGFLDYETTKVSEIMSPSILSMNLHQPVFEANEFMSKNNIRHLAVTENDEIVGIISITDLVACYLNLLGLDE